eukprot:5602028-Alexandrium_andersonii.AAC.1
MIPGGADDVYVEVSLEPDITRVVFAFPADGGRYVRVEPFGAGEVRELDDFEVYYCEGRPGPDVWYEPCGLVGGWARAAALLPRFLFGWCPRVEK